MKVIVKCPNNKDVHLNYLNPVRAEVILNEVKEYYPYPIYSCKLNNAYRGLSHEVYHDCEIEFLDITNQATWLVYQNSLVLLYLKAVHDVLGKKTLVSIRNALSKGLFTIIHSKYTDIDVEKIEERMHQLVEMNLPIIKKHYSKEEAIQLAQQTKLQEAANLLSSADKLDEVEIYSLEDEVDIFYNFLVPSTAYLSLFELKQYKHGIILRFPHQSDPNTIPEFKADTLLYDAFKNTEKWGDIMNIQFVSDLNNKITNNSINRVLLMQEALHEKRIGEIADKINQKKARVVLICGPSSSGKTTFANRLCIQLEVLGIKTMYMGTDDYFVNRQFTPKDENGEYDYENIDAVDTKLFVDNLKGLLAGEKVDLPTYNFIDGVKEFGQRLTSIDSNTVLVIEGIHALNGLLTEGIDDKDKFKIYISPFTPIGIDHHNRISSTDCRLLRRMARDFRTRGKSVQDTIDQWYKVRKGEDVNIFPFCDEAEEFFNSNCIYEFAVLKKYCQPLLQSVQRSEKAYCEAQRLLSFLRFFDDISNDEYISNTSIIREFIGNSIIV